jgi:hypothetical protein
MRANYWSKHLMRRDRMDDTSIWEYIKMGIQEIGWVGVDWIDLAQHRVQWRGGGARA